MNVHLQRVKKETDAKMLSKLNAAKPGRANE